MSFSIDRFGSDASNVKSILGGVCYYRYYNKDNNTVTNPGYFPASLGLQLGDRITVIPSTKTDPDEEYIVSDITNRVVTVTKVEAGLDTSKVVNADILPEAGADNLGYVYLYTGETDASYTHGYIYECQKSATYTDSVTFEPATLSGTVVTATAGALSNLCAEYITGNITSIVSGTLVYLAAGDLWLLTGKDAEDNIVGSFQVYTPDYEDAGFTFTGTPVDGDVIAFTCTIEETSATYAWVRQDVQPQPAKELPTQAGNSGKYLKTNGVSASWAAVESLPDQSGQSGKFLTTDGTDASWGSINALQNTATGTGALTILGTPTNATGSINIGEGSFVNYTGIICIGKNSTGSGGQGVAIGEDTSISGGGVVVGRMAKHNSGSGGAGIAIGERAEARDKSIAIGTEAKASSTYSAIQIGSGTNSETGTMCVALTTGSFPGTTTNYKLLQTDGTIPADRLASTTGLADGNYKLRLTISGGVATLSFVAE